MKIAFIHYHLKTGGVTSVVRQQAEAVRKTGEVLIMTGEPAVFDFPADIVHIPGLGYDLPHKNIPDPENVAKSVYKAIFSKWKDGCDILHVHNPTLAKNKNFLKILRILQKKKIKLFLQIHDFAEDGRPLSYFFDEYPSDCHYGVINSRDYNILLSAGLKLQGVHQIPNTVTPFHFKHKSVALKNRILYPVRAIRRKNIGEAILLSLFFKNRENLAITLPPNSPIDIKSHTGWKKFAKEKKLDVKFDVGLKNDFTDIVMSSKFLITTSITEGFGFSFLEPWTAKKILWGRKLDNICHDFEKNKIKLDHLYTKLLVPIKWIDAARLYKIWNLCILKICTLFDYNINEEKIAKSFAIAAKNDNIDFGLLDERFQKQIILRVLSDKKDKERLIALNPYLSYPGYVPNKNELIQNNMSAVLNNYNTTIYGKKLFRIYSKVVKNSVRQSINKNILLSKFLNPEQFSLLKWNDYVE